MLHGLLSPSSLVLHFLLRCGGLLEDAPNKKGVSGLLLSGGPVDSCHVKLGFLGRSAVAKRNERERAWRYVVPPPPVREGDLNSN